MHSVFALVALYAASTAAHGVITEIQGANGVNMPGLSVVDGTPRDCPDAGCGSQADTAIIDDDEIAGGGSPLGHNDSGDISAEPVITAFMGNSAGPGAGAGGGNNTRRGLLDGLLGGGDDAGGGLLGGGIPGLGGDNNGAVTTEGTPTPAGTTEDGVARNKGKGAARGLPTAADDGTVSMTFHQINQDGAGPLNAQVDATSGGKDASAFQDAQVTQDVPGGILGISGTTVTDFPVKVKMPAGMTCEGKVGNVRNVCIVRMRNDTPAGPFGGSAAFTQSAAGRKRAIAFRLLKKRVAARQVARAWAAKQKQ
jgi:hypothetical protein